MNLDFLCYVIVSGAVMYAHEVMASVALISVDRRAPPSFSVVRSYREAEGEHVANTW